MTKDLYVLIAYLLFINFITFMMFCVDKQDHRRHRHVRGISTHLYFTLAIIGGSLGELLGMFIFHHKLHHKEYVIFIPIIFFIQAVIMYYVLGMYFDTQVQSADLVPA